MPASAQGEAKNDALSRANTMYDLFSTGSSSGRKQDWQDLTTNETIYQAKPAYRINLLAIGSKKG